MAEIEKPSTRDDTTNSVPASTTSTAPKIPVPIKLGSTKPGSNVSKDEMDLKSYLTHVSLWRQPLLTAKYFIFAVVFFYSTCEDGYSYSSFLLTALVYRTLLVSTPFLLAKHLKTSHSSVATALTKIGTLISDQIPLPTPSDISFWVSGLSDVLESKLVSAFKAVKQSEEEFRMLKVVLTHCLLSIFVLWLFSLRTLTILFTLYYFLWPITYFKFSEQIDKVFDLTIEKTKPAFEKMTEKGKEISKTVLTKTNEMFDTVKTKYDEFRTKQNQKTKTA